ncbi:MAG: DUF2232 domain-containing protein [Gammaproteobacteria bacterium]|nr:DUF2232 domain-containing protein [Gammaproteobacteria bacterium]
MKALVAYIMRGRMQAGGVVAVCAGFSLLLPPITGPLAWLSAAGVGLVTLRIGARQGVVVMAGAGAALALLGMLLSGSPLLGLVFALVLWLPVWGLALVLASTGSLAWVLGGAALLGVLFVSGVHLWVENPAEAWRAALEISLRPALEQLAALPEPAQMERLLDEMAQAMTGLLTISLMLSVTVSLLVARWWQGLLYNAGGFQREFHGLRLARACVLPVLLLLGMALLAEGGMRQWLLEVLAVLVVVYMIQGLAFAHRLVAQRNAHTAWLAALYGLLVLMLPQMVVLLALVGLLYSAGLAGNGSNDRPTPV